MQTPKQQHEERAKKILAKRNGTEYKEPEKADGNIEGYEDQAAKILEKREAKDAEAHVVDNPDVNPLDLEGAADPLDEQLDKEIADDAADEEFEASIPGVEDITITPDYELMTKKELSVELGIPFNPKTTKPTLLAQIANR